MKIEKDNAHKAEYVTEQRAHHKAHHKAHHREWHDRWETDRIGFHRSDYQAPLLAYWPEFDLPIKSTVLVPLCGKTLDMVWLAEQGHEVIGVELSDIAAKGFFAENAISYEISTLGKFRKYQGGAITILVGDIFDLTTHDIPNIKAVYDRAALIALSATLREIYVKHLSTVLNKDAQILLITLAYDQAKMDGPPFSVPSSAVQTLFGSWCEISELNTLPPEDFRGIEASEIVTKLVVK